MPASNPNPMADHFARARAPKPAPSRVLPALLGIALIGGAIAGVGAIVWFRAFATPAVAANAEPAGSTTIAPRSPAAPPAEVAPAAPELLSPVVAPSAAELARAASGERHLAGLLAEKQQQLDEAQGWLDEVEKKQLVKLAQRQVAITKEGSTPRFNAQVALNNLLAKVDDTQREVRRLTPLRDTAAKRLADFRAQPPR